MIIILTIGGENVMLALLTVQTVNALIVLLTWTKRFDLWCTETLPHIHSSDRM